MPVYAIGDLQGCLDPLLRLLDSIHFDASSDKLWFVGDIINRGPQSLEALRFVHSLGDSAITVMGNHDLHLLATWCGIRKPSHKDTLAAILENPDCDDLCHWIRRLPLLHSDTELLVTMAHAGVYPLWSDAEAAQHAQLAEQALRSDDYRTVLQNYYDSDRNPSAGNDNRWRDTLPADQQINFILSAFTQMRYLHADGSLDFAAKLHPDTADPAVLVPWFRYPQRKTLQHAVVFGHWSTVGDTTQGQDAAQNVVGIDRGYVWGGSLAAVELPKMRMIEQSFIDAPAPEN